MIAMFSATAWGASRCDAAASEPEIGWGWFSALPRIVSSTSPLVKFGGWS